jgi:glycosyltransferase involved in cell wall biosynthesis
MPEPTESSLPPNTAQPAPRIPSVSVVIPAYNAAGHIAAALDSVFFQTFTDYEVVLANDGSPDTAQLESAIQPYLSRIIYLKQENRGPSSARNLGIRHARGEWLAFLDSDDAWLPDYLAEQLRLLRANPTLDMVYCDAILEGQTIAAGKTFMQVCPSIGPVTFESVLTEQTQVLTSATVVRRQRIMTAGLFDEELRRSEDHDLWLRVLYSGGKVEYQRRALVRRCVRADGQGSTPGALLAGEIQSLRKLEQTLDLTQEARALLAERLKKLQADLDFVEGKEFLLAAQPDKAYQSLSRVHAFSPTLKLRAILLGLRIAPRLTVFGARYWRSRTPHLRRA